MSRPTAAGSRVGAVLLAAGGSRRMGRPKQLEPFLGEPLVRRAARTILASRVHGAVAVVGHRAADVIRALEGLEAPGAPNLRAVENPRWSEGQASSVRVGLEALGALRDVDAALFVPCDQPWLSAAVLDRLIFGHEADPDTIRVPTYGGRRGAPVLFPRPFFERLLRLEGDEGGRRILGNHAGELREVPMDDTRAGLDADTPEELERLKALQRP